MNLTFIETKTFTRKLFKDWNENLYFELQNALLDNPDLGNVITHSEGLRKVRWKAEGRGKRGGIRIIYFWAIRRDIILMLDIFPKNEKADLSDKELKNLVDIKREEIGEENE